MFRYCSSVAFLAMLAFSCSSKNSGDDDNTMGTGTGGAAGYQFTGGAPSTGGAPDINAGGSSGSDSNSEKNLKVINTDDWAKINADSCAGWTAEGEMTPANIEFIVDTSGSMTDVSKNTTDGRSKWEITRVALEDALNKLPRLTTAGMLLWPNKPTIPNSFTEPYKETGGVDACVNVNAMVPLDKMGAVGSDHRVALAAALDAVAPIGGTPMADAYNVAIEKNYGNNTMMAGGKYAVLITDGQPTIQLGCEGTGDERHPVDGQPVLDSIKGSYDGSLFIKTFVIGSPGSESNSSTGADVRPWLSQAAQLGGTKATDNCTDTGPNYCHFDMSQSADFATGFSAALKNITGQILDCKYTINDASLQGQTIDRSAVNVVYQVNGSNAYGDMKLVGEASDPSCPDDNGWYFDPADPSAMTIQLCPITCAKIQQDAGAVISIRGGCATVVLIA
jgi:hypothetical protein